MADDGMLLNFELPTNALVPPKISYRGGSWQARLAAKKKSASSGKQRNSLPQFEELGSQNEELILPDQHPNKRRRTDPLNEKPIPRPAAKPRGDVISSLFTYNPTSSGAARKDDSVNDTPIVASNAPLDGELGNFTNLGVSTTLANHLLKKLAISAPTAIQRKSVEQLCRTDKDAFIQAETGSGKTLAYLLPIVERIHALSLKAKAEGLSLGRESGLLALILAPTRELAKQINTVLESLLSCCHYVVGGTVIGGEKKKSEKARLRKGVNILVATPGRLTDHLDNTEVLDVSKVRWLVLDEGDRLMELGFEKDIQKIVSVLNLRSREKQERTILGLPEKRMTILCSATLKTDVDQLRKIALKDAVSISVEPEETEPLVPAKETSFSAPAQLKQSYIIVPAKQRLVALLACLKQTFRRKGSVIKCIVFLSCADSVDFHFEILLRKDGSGVIKDNHDGREEETESKRSTKSSKIQQGNTIVETRTRGSGAVISSDDNPVEVFRLHGSLQQATRTSTLTEFSKCSQASVLICTDVASRGLDLPDIDLVIEYDPAFSKDDHLHRVGRTARAGKDGRAMIFLMPGCEEGYVEILKEGRPRNLTRHESEDVLKKGFAPASGVVSSGDWEEKATDLQLDVERWALENPNRLEQARRAFQSHIRAYATHVAPERGIFDLQQLHLGHLAKAFALRDKPGSIRVPGMRPSDVVGKKSKQDRKEQAGRKAAIPSKRAVGADNGFDATAANAEESRRKMISMTKAMGGASEFNLG